MRRWQQKPNAATPRVNYDQIAHAYDGQPFRQKQVDPHMLSFMKEKAQEAKNLTVLDMGCGTGNQLVANHLHLAGARLIGLDLFHGMLRQARPKAAEILWIQANSAAPPFPENCFDFISNQYSFHHVRDKVAMIEAVFRILRPGGRFVMTNICPREMADWLYYRYFPAAYEIDLYDFLSQRTLSSLLIQSGFVEVELDLDHLAYDIGLVEFMQSVKKRDHCSQLMAIRDNEYQAGLRQIETELAEAGGENIALPNTVCILTAKAEKS